jgi:cation transport ATPase
MGTCEEKPEVEKRGIGEEAESKRVLVGFAVWLGVTILVGGLLDLFFEGIPLAFTVPLLGVEGSFSLILYYAAVLAVAVYIGVSGLKGLVVERRFSVEFLMAVAGLGALFLDARFEAATVLFLYFLTRFSARRIMVSQSNLMSFT